MKARRDILSEIEHDPTTHASLWLDRYLPIQTVSGEDVGRGEKAKHLRKLERKPPPVGYADAFARWMRLHEPRCAWVGRATAEGRLVIGLGDKTTLEVGMTLHHTWGVPFLPGAALKGLAASAARTLLVDPDWSPGEGEEPSSYDLLFGTTERQGAVVFHDALWIPEGETIPLHMDVMTVHHPRYYQHSGAAAIHPPPSDTDSPNPVSFLSATGSYQILLEGPAPWCKAALDILKLGLQLLGIGAKTNAGYGRMSLDITDTRPPSAERWWEELGLELEGDRERYEWLVALSQEASPFPAEVDAEECKALLREQLSGAIDYAREEQEGGEVAREIRELEAELKEHKGQKPGDKRSAEFRRWKNKRSKLERSIKGAEKRHKGDERAKQRAIALLKWLGVADGETTEG